jgi:murein L,D-transpeptidase YcbB/YkuD
MDPVLPLGPGDCDPLVVKVKKVLAHVEDYTDEYSTSLVERVRGFQLLVGLDPDGFLDEATLVALGLPGDLRGE